MVNEKKLVAVQQMPILYAIESPTNNFKADQSGSGIKLSNVFVQKSLPRLLPKSNTQTIHLNDECAS